MDRPDLLPPELAPSLREAAEKLISEVGLRKWDTAPRAAGTGIPVCVFCRKPGRLGGHHTPDGEIAYAHHRCHRRHHRAENNRAGNPGRRVPRRPAPPVQLQYPGEKP